MPPGVWACRHSVESRCSRLTNEVCKWGGAGIPMGNENYDRDGDFRQRSGLLNVRAIAREAPIFRCLTERCRGFPRSWLQY